MKTRDRIILAASELFAEKGFDNVSVRDITKKANANLSSISYHFADKEGLTQEVIQSTLDPLNRQRMELLDAAIAQAGGEDKLTLAGVIKAFITPSFIPETHGGHPGLVARFAAHTIVTPRKQATPLFIEVMTRFTGTIKKMYPDMTPQEIYERLRICSASSLTFRSFNHMTTKADPSDHESPHMSKLDLLVEFCTAGFTKALS